MIRNDNELKYTRERIADFEQQICGMRDKLTEQGFSDEDIALATEPTRLMRDELEWERNFYERLVSEGPDAVPEYPAGQKGKALIALRVAQRLSQKQLAEALNVSPALVSRDEKNDYRGVTQERYAKTLTALNVEEAGGKYRSLGASVIPLTIVTYEAASFTPDYHDRFTVSVGEKGS